MIAAASPDRAAACNGVVAPLGAESFECHLLALFFLKRFFGAIVVWCDLGGAAVAALALRRAAFFEADFDTMMYRVFREASDALLSSVLAAPGPVSGPFYIFRCTK